MKLFARLAEENVGFIDWTPFIPKVGRSAFVIEISNC